jgi:hypothetical protein
VEPTPCKPQSTHSARYTTLLEVQVKDFIARVWAHRGRVVDLQGKPGVLKNVTFHNTPHSRVNFQKRTNGSNPNSDKQTRIKMFRIFSAYSG